jgi:hypothetical protein
VPVVGGAFLISSTHYFFNTLLATVIEFGTHAVCLTLDASYRVAIRM